MSEAKEEFVAEGVYPSDKIKERLSAELVAFIEKVEQQQLDVKYRENYETLKNPPNAEWADEPEIQWRLARACIRLAQSMERGCDEHIALVKEGVEVMKKAEPNISTDEKKSKYMVNFLMAGLMGLATEFMTTEERVAHASDVKNYAMKAHEADEEQPGPLHIIGMWCLRVAQIGVAARAGSAVLYDSLPESSYEEALTWLSKSLKKDKVKSPTYGLNLLSIGQVLALMDDKEGAEKVFNKLIKLKTDLPAYVQQQKRAKDELAKLKKSSSWF